MSQKLCCEYSFVLKTFLKLQFCACPNVQIGHCTNRDQLTAGLIQNDFVYVYCSEQLALAAFFPTSTLLLLGPMFNVSFRYSSAGPDPSMNYFVLVSKIGKIHIFSPSSCEQFLFFCLYRTILFFQRGNILAIAYRFKLDKKFLVSSTIFITIVHFSKPNTFQKPQQFAKRQHFPF